MNVLYFLPLVWQYEFKGHKFKIKDSMNVLYIGDSREMKGGVSTVMKTLEQSSMWKEFHCCWLETQVNSKLIIKFSYLLKSFFKGLFIIPRYDICHFQTEPGMGIKTLLPFFLYARLWRKKIVVQYHVGNQLLSYVDNTVFRYWTRHTDKTLFLGKKWLAEMKKRLPFINNTDFIYNPVPKQEKSMENNKYFLYAAVFRPNKGYDVFIQAFAKIANEYPDWKIVLCGSGEKKYLNDVYKLVEDFHLEQKAILPGWVYGTEKENYFKKANAYCMNSKVEGLPMSVLESMSFGVPVITTPVGCLPEFLEDRKSAWIYNFGDVDALSKAMKESIENVELRQQIADNAYELINKHFTTEQVCDKLNRIYKGL